SSGRGRRLRALHDVARSAARAFTRVRLQPVAAGTLCRSGAARRAAASRSAARRARCGTLAARHAALRATLAGAAERIQRGRDGAETARRRAGRRAARDRTHHGRAMRRVLERLGERPAAFLAPAAIVLGVVTFFPIVYVLWLSLARYSLLGDEPSFVGLDNFVRLASDARFWNALGNTLYFTLVSVVLEIAIGLGFALLLARPFVGRAAMRAVVLLPWAIPTVVAARMWEWMYNGDFGVINYLLGSGINWLGDPVWAMHAAIAMDV